MSALSSIIASYEAATPGRANHETRALTSAATTRGCRTNGVPSEGFKTMVMGQNFIACDRDQSLLMPPDVRQWLPEGHTLAWFVLDAVAEMDLEAFYGAYRC